MSKIRCGYIAIVGKPNAGKSTLLNAIIKEKVSIVSPKAQTTRNNITGIYNQKDCQLIFFYTPVCNIANNHLDEYMQKAIKGAVVGVDVLIIAMDGTKKLQESDFDIINRYSVLQIPIILVITKIDELNNEKIFKLLASLNNLEKVSDIVPVSCLKNKNIDTLIQLLKKYVPEVDENQRYFDQDMYTDKSVKFIASEIIREKALYFLDKEIPHGIAVSITKFEEIDKLINIDADIICEKQSHKNIIIGKSGNMLKRIGHEARVSIQKVVQCKVNLNLWVKVKENWRNNSGFLNEIGYNNSDLS